MRRADLARPQRCAERPLRGPSDAQNGPCEAPAKRREALRGPSDAQGAARRAQGSPCEALRRSRGDEHTKLHRPRMLISMRRTAPGKPQRCAERPLRGPSDAQSGLCKAPTMRRVALARPWRCAERLLRGPGHAQSGPCEAPAMRRVGEGNWKKGLSATPPPAAAAAAAAARPQPMRQPRVRLCNGLPLVL